MIVVFVFGKRRQNLNFSIIQPSSTFQHYLQICCFKLNYTSIGFITQIYLKKWSWVKLSKLTNIQCQSQNYHYCYFGFRTWGLHAMATCRGFVIWILTFGILIFRIFLFTQPHFGSIFHSILFQAYQGYMRYRIHWDRDLIHENVLQC